MRMCGFLRWIGKIDLAKQIQRETAVCQPVMLGGIGGRGRRDEGQRTRWLDGITDSMGMSLSKLQ